MSGTPLGRPYNKDYDILGSIRGPPEGNYHVMAKDARFFSIVEGLCWLRTGVILIGISDNDCPTWVIFNAGSPCHVCAILGSAAAPAQAHRSLNTQRAY